MPAWYNEHDKNAAAWLRELIARGLIAPGVVDERSIVDVQPRDLDGFTQCHFFAGIGGWPLALRLTMWPDDRPVWTGSCPCQPFSAAGKRKGAADERHLWPEFRRIIAECDPAIVFGEQVASKDGRTWLAGVRADLEALGYGVGAADLCAAGVGAPHIRQRLWWLADAVGGLAEPYGRERNGLADCQGCFADGSPTGWQQGNREPERGSATGFWSTYDVVHCTDGKARRFESGSFPLAYGVSNRVGRLRGYGNAIVPQVAAEFISAFCEMKAAA